MARYAIDTENALGVAIPQLRRIARDYGPSHVTALALWQTGIHDARLLATMVAEPERTTPGLCDAWAADFRSWDLCDQACTNLFRHTGFAHSLIDRYRKAEPEFVKRAGFTMIAVLAVHDKTPDAAVFTHYLRVIEESANDPRNFVKKAVSWALRQIGKRNRTLHTRATAVAEILAGRNDRTARWIGNDALRELRNPKVMAKLGVRSR